jgi:cysteinyl-tRNA synthetase
LRRLLDRFGSKQLKPAAAALAQRATRTLQQHAQVLGLLGLDAEEFLDQQRRLKLAATGLTEGEVEHAIASRQEARKARNFAESDRIREDLARKGIQLEDGPDGTRWRVSSDKEELDEAVT